MHWRRHDYGGFVIDDQHPRQHDHDHRTCGHYYCQPVHIDDDDDPADLKLVKFVTVPDDDDAYW